MALYSGHASTEIKYVTLTWMPLYPRSVGHGQTVLAEGAHLTAGRWLGVQAERGGEAEVVGRELERLWAALDMPGIDVDRAALTSLLEGPLRLHSLSIEKVTHALLRPAQPTKTAAASRRPLHAVIYGSCQLQCLGWQFATSVQFVTYVKALACFLIPAVMLNLAHERDYQKLSLTSNCCLKHEQSDEANQLQCAPNPKFAIEPRATMRWQMSCLQQHVPLCSFGRYQQI